MLLNWEHREEHEEGSDLCTFDAIKKRRRKESIEEEGKAGKRREEMFTNDLNEEDRSKSQRPGIGCFLLKIGRESVNVGCGVEDVFDDLKEGGREESQRRVERS